MWQHFAVRAGPVPIMGQLSPPMNAMRKRVFTLHVIASYSILVSDLSRAGPYYPKLPY